ncbi:helix-turn-helix domain-containing protein [Lysinibacillus xylanilyticus]|uniref:Helix-turn-helix domain-containing protein n=1 Tax=Lysinibacillus xylanilyticus TaxID=582475 RepID=A0ABT4ENQ7_9BACI|nr:helix-turn-helix domain-containing protein [Lysinibacillus xylanilyticus]MCY9547305.1 helix-turn-helix domain-containing protein [Lysinibacillus xylanilyticus]
MADYMPKAQSVLPFKYDSGWTGIPNAIFEIYSFHPKFTASCLKVYIFLLHRYNISLGYAFPTHDQIADTLGLNRITVVRAIKALKELDLIVVDKSHTCDNDVYYFKSPLTERNAFEQRFPEAIYKRIEHKKTRLKDAQTRHERKVDFKNEIKN